MLSRYGQEENHQLSPGNQQKTATKMWLSNKVLCKTAPPVGCKIGTSMKQKIFCLC